MKLGGWILLITAWILIISMAIFCYGRIFKKGLGGVDSGALKRLKK